MPKLCPVQLISHLFDLLSGYATDLEMEPPAKEKMSGLDLYTFAHDLDHYWSFVDNG